MNYPDSVVLRDAIAGELQKTVQLQINQVYAARLDPAVPPTYTPRITPGPSSTPTATVLPSTPTATSTNTPTSTSTSTATSTATPTSTSTPTPASVVLENTFGGGVYLRQFPNGPSLWLIPPGTQLTVLYGYEIVDGWVWIEVVDPEGRLGWIPQFYTVLSTITPTPTLENGTN